MDRKYVTEAEIRAAKEIDLLTYLQIYEPHELVQEGSSYHTRTHDSLKISNGMWHWFSRGIGGKTALDYLIHVRGMDFVPAVQLLCEGRVMLVRNPVPAKEKVFVLPPKYPDCSRAAQYLYHRGIAGSVINRCVEEGILYEADRYHNAVFVGRDKEGVPRYAMQRSTGQRTLKLEVEGSDKRFSFSISGTGDRLYVAESAIDAMSIATIAQIHGKRWRSGHYLSLGGVSVKKNSNELPMALSQYLSDHPEIRRICLHLDRDVTGRLATRTLMALLGDSYTVGDYPPPSGKDYNDHLCIRLEIPITRVKPKIQER